MKNILNKTIIVTIAVSALVSCKPDLKAPASDKGSIDVTKYVSIGNSITSGFADGALYLEGQQVSYASLLAEQFKTVGGGEFVVPYMPAGVGVGSSLNAKLILGYKTDCQNVSGLSPVPAAQNGDVTGLFTGIASKGPFNNMGVPGAKVTTVVYPGYGNATLPLGSFNPFFSRMLNPSEYTTASMLSKAAEQNPTFFSVFIGNNDVLGNALAGGMSSTPITPSAGGIGTGFDASYDLIINTMMANGAKGVIANIPDITNIPHFTTVPYNGLTLDATQAAGLNAYYAAYYPAAGMTFTPGSNLPFMIQDAAAPGGVRKIKSNEYILLGTPQDSLKCAGWGSKKPLADQYVLNVQEVLNLKEAAAAYNAKIKTVAEEKGLAFVDVNAFMANAKKGIVYNGITSSAAFVSGGAFSLDGIHLTPRGNAMLANEFIKAINATYGSTINLVDVTKYNGVVFPNP
jgi:hypothetical protein